MEPTTGIFAVRDMLRRPLHIRGTEGVVVVTREKDAEDHILASGEGITLRPKGTLVIRGLTEAAAATVSGGRWGEDDAVIRLDEKALSAGRTIRRS